MKHTGSNLNWGLSGHEPWDSNIWGGPTTTDSMLLNKLPKLSVLRGKGGE